MLKAVQRWHLRRCLLLVDGGETLGRTPAAERLGCLVKLCFEDTRTLVLRFLQVADQVEKLFKNLHAGQLLRYLVLDQLELLDLLAQRANVMI